MKYYTFLKLNGQDWCSSSKELAQTVFKETNPCGGNASIYVQEHEQKCIGSSEQLTKDNNKAGREGRMFSKYVTGHPARKKMGHVSKHRSKNWLKGYILWWWWLLTSQTLTGGLILIEVKDLINCWHAVLEMSPLPSLGKPQKKGAGGE